MIGFIKKQRKNSGKKIKKLLKKNEEK